MPSPDVKTVAMGHIRLGTLPRTRFELVADG